MPRTYAEDAEIAVRDYLTYLANPESLTDPAKIEKLQAAVDKAKDPVEKLKAMAELRKAQDVAGDEYEAAFVRNAKTFAEAEGVIAEDFRALGVPDKVLRDAGLTKGASRRSRKATGRTNAPRLTLEELEQLVPEGEFKVNEFAQAVNRPTPTARNYLSRLVGEGKVKVVGKDESGRGKPALIYRKA